MKQVIFLIIGLMVFQPMLSFGESVKFETIIEETKPFHTTFNLTSSDRTIFDVIYNLTSDDEVTTVKSNSETQPKIMLHVPQKNELDTKISAFSSNEVMLEWEEPFLFGKDKIAEYQVYRKEIKPENITEYYEPFHTLTQTELINYQNYTDEWKRYKFYTNTYQTFLIDKVSIDNYYDYSIIPIVEKYIDTGNKHGITRNMNIFNDYLLEQQLKSENIFFKLYGNIQNPNFENSTYFSYDFPNNIPKLSDLDIIQIMKNEEEKAKELFLISWE